LAEILLLQSDQRTCAILKESLEARYRSRRISHVQEIDGLIPRAGPRACVVDIFDPGDPLNLFALRQLRRRHRSIALVVASDFTQREMDLYHLGRSGVDGIIRLEEAPRGREILRAVESAIATALARVAVQRIRPGLPALGQEALRWTIEQAGARPQVQDLATALGLSLSGLQRELRVRKLASPRTFLLWGRLIQASHLLERSDETVENVAFRLGYATGGTLRRAMKRVLGCSPTTLLQQGGLDWTLEILRQRTSLRSDP